MVCSWLPGMLLQAVHVGGWTGACWCCVIRVAVSLTLGHALELVLTMGMAWVDQLRCAWQVYARVQSWQACLIGCGTLFHTGECLNCASACVVVFGKADKISEYA